MSLSYAKCFQIHCRQPQSQDLQKYVLRGAMLGTDNIPITLGNALPERSGALRAREGGCHAPGIAMAMTVGPRKAGELPLWQTVFLSLLTE